MARRTHVLMRAILDILLVRDHPDAQGMEEVVLALIDQETELEEYSPCNPNFKSKLPFLMTR